MRTRIVLLVIVAVTTIASSACRTVQPIATPLLGVSSLSSETAPRVAENTPQPGAEISNHPIVAAILRLSDPTTPDNRAAAQIATAYNIKSYQQCASWAQSPGTRQRVTSLVDFKTALPPLIKPEGPISIYVAKLAAGKEITSGDLAAHLALGHKALDSFLEDANLNCAALLSDIGLLGPRLAAAIGLGRLR